MALIEVVTPAGDTVGVDSGDSQPALHIPLSAVSASTVLVSTGVLLLGWSLLEPTGAAPFTAYLVNGEGADGDYGAVLDLAQGASATNTLGTRGVWLRRGLYLQIVTGSVTGAVYYRPYLR